MKKEINILEHELPIEIKPQTGGGFVATCPIWSDCYAQGDTIEEVILEITSVAQSLIEIYKEEDLKLPLKLQSKKQIGKSSFSVPIMTSV